MNEEIKSRLIKYADQLEKLGGDALDFTSKEMPLYVQELLNWIFYSSVFTIVAFTILLIFSIILGRWIELLVRSDAPSYNPDKNNGVGICIGALCSVICIIGIMTNSYYALKVAVAPRVVLVEKLMELK